MPSSNALALLVLCNAVNAFTTSFPASATLPITRNAELRTSSNLRMSALSRRAVGGAAVAATVFSPLTANAEGYPRISMQTTEGEMEFELWDDVAPKHVKSFLKLTKEGFFDGCSFHRIIPGFVIQGGDPNTKIGYGPSGTLDGADKKQVRKWGTGGPGYTVPAEFNDRLHEFGVLSMARAADPNSAGSQFFVCLGRLPSLDNKYTVCCARAP